jgi:hypothetical protein
MSLQRTHPVKQQSGHDGKYRYQEFTMLPLLSFHALVAHRGDGLRPELLALLQREAPPQMPSSNVSHQPASIQTGEGAELVLNDPTAE